MWNDKETDIDLLDHEKIAQTVLEIVSDSHLRPLTIGIYGDWGVGKSSVISLLQREIDIGNKNETLNAHAIMFNGWLFQGYEDAKTALMETVVLELAKLQPRHKKIQKLATSLINRVNWLKVAKVSANAAIMGMTGLPIGSVLGHLAPLLLHKDKEGHLTEPFKADEKEKFLKEAPKETVTSQIHAFRREFKELIETSKVDQVIILVDDLDRCLPKSVIEILEAIRLFLFVEGTTFVISADERMIEYAVREHFPNLPASYNEYTKNYLEKLIQIPIRIPFLNQLQTGNYIKFLMLQHHLGHDFSEVRRIYEVFIAKRKNPYENTILTYELIKEALGSETITLKETLLVADQLSPTLSQGLKGNPRNVKRFLNTLFLRMKVARIYGLNDVIQLNVLAKLMLLERFQTDFFEKIVAEIMPSVQGASLTIDETEHEITVDNKGDKKGQKAPTSTPATSVEKNSNENFKTWIILEPSFSGLDLRPYIFISKEKAIGLPVDEGLSPLLTKLLEQLNSNSDISLNAVSKTLPQISFEDSLQLYEILETESRQSSDLKNIPKSAKGLLRLIEAHPALEIKFIDLLGSYPHTAIGPWAISQLSGLKTPTAIEKFSKLLESWSKQTDNTVLSGLASVRINNKTK
ncbi:MAG: kap P-loop domain protein [Mucilaginibacter sp.]|nr:kap P-loop domain protein [Mucilaginibacter sp.]